MTLKDLFTRYDPEFPASGFLFCRETLIYDYELAFDLSQTDRSLEPGDEIPGLFFPFVISLDPYI